MKGGQNEEKLDCTAYLSSASTNECPTEKTDKIDALCYELAPPKHVPITPRFLYGTTIKTSTTSIPFVFLPIIANNARARKHNCMCSIDGHDRKAQNNELRSSHQVCYEV